jgi:hypothetical protein
MSHYTYSIWRRNRKAQRRNPGITDSWGGAPARDPNNAPQAVFNTTIQNVRGELVEVKRSEYPVTVDDSDTHLG